ncbi:hypothetical protein [Sphingomonas sp. LT1P40]|uniref:hypothetical protein n=1 Tax=Alteristakelama amylovorans TaxID=3096166 RepID=UPI002FC82F76
MAALAIAVAAMPQRPMKPVERLNADLLAASTATATLEKWCGERRLADPARVRAAVDRSPAPKPSAAIRYRLKVSASEPLAFRRVHLMCGTHILSVATNWYVPARLTPEMNAALANGDAPFGRVILPLSPSRQTLSARISSNGSTILRHRAMVLDSGGHPLAEVTENYQRVLVSND